MELNTSPLLIILYITMAFSICAVGWFSHDVYNSMNDKRELKGLWFSNLNYSSVSKQAYEMDNAGEWVCTNIVKSMTFKDIIETCTHEASHELFARQCTDNVEKCMEAIEK
jgi:hypothetical protein